MWARTRALRLRLRVAASTFNLKLCWPTVRFSSWSMRELQKIPCVSSWILYLFETFAISNSKIIAVWIAFVEPSILNFWLGTLLTFSYLRLYERFLLPGYCMRHLFARKTKLTSTTVRLILFQVCHYNSPHIDNDKQYSNIRTNVNCMEADRFLWTHLLQRKCSKSKSNFSSIFILCLSKVWDACCPVKWFLCSSWDTIYCFIVPPTGF